MQATNDTIAHIMGDRAQLEYNAECELMRTDMCFHQGPTLHSDRPLNTIISQLHLENHNALIIYCTVLGKFLVFEKNFRFLTKISILDQIYLTQIAIFDWNCNFWSKLRILIKISVQDSILLLLNLAVLAFASKCIEEICDIYIKNHKKSKCSFKVCIF